MKTFGDRLKEVRINKGITQQELADRVDCTRQLICKYERGDISSIPFDKMEKIAKALATTTDYLSGKEISPDEERARKVYSAFKTAPKNLQDAICMMLGIGHSDFYATEESGTLTDEEKAKLFSDEPS